jgi:hypothetical protein
MALRVFGLWLLYSVVGALIVLMALGAGGDLGSESATSPTRFRTKLVSALSGAALAALLLCVFYPPRHQGALLLAGVHAWLVLSIWSWVWIARDLRR